MPHNHDFKRFPELRNSQMDQHYWDSPHKQILEDFTAKVARVKDGDTIELEWIDRNFNFPLRLAKIEAPELKEIDGKKSGKWLESRILGEDVEIIIDINNRVGAFGRLLGEVVHFGVNVGDESLMLGYSVPFVE